MRKTRMSSKEIQAKINFLPDLLRDFCGVPLSVQQLGKLNDFLGHWFYAHIQNWCQEQEAAGNVRIVRNYKKYSPKTVYIWLAGEEKTNLCHRVMAFLQQKKCRGASLPQIASGLSVPETSVGVALRVLIREKKVKQPIAHLGPKVKQYFIKSKETEKSSKAERREPAVRAVVRGTVKERLAVLRGMGMRTRTTQTLAQALKPLSLQALMAATKQPESQVRIELEELRRTGMLELAICESETPHAFLYSTRTTNSEIGYQMVLPQWKEHRCEEGKA